MKYIIIMKCVSRNSSYGIQLHNIHLLRYPFFNKNKNKSSEQYLFSVNQTNHTRTKAANEIDMLKQSDAMEIRKYKLNKCSTFLMYSW